MKEESTLESEIDLETVAGAPGEYLSCLIGYARATRRDLIGLNEKWFALVGDMPGGLFSRDYRRSEDFSDDASLAKAISTLGPQRIVLHGGRRTG